MNDPTYRGFGVLGFWGFGVLGFWDDLLMPGGPTLEEAQNRRTQAMNEGTSLGWVWSLKKCPTPFQKGDAIGFEICTVKGLCTLSKSRFEKIALAILACKNGPVTAKVLAKLIGMIVSAKHLRLQLLWFINPALDELIEITRVIKPRANKKTTTGSLVKKVNCVKSGHTEN